MRAFVVFLALLVHAGSTAAGAWQPWGPPGTPQAPLGIAAHPRTPGLVLAGTGLDFSSTDLVTHRSTDGGITWTQHSAVAGTNWQTRDLRLAMSQEWSYLTFGSRYARSQDGAVTWTPLDGGATFENTLIGVNPDNGAELVVYRSAGQALLHSLDAGTTWTSITVPAIPVGGTVDWTTRTLYIVPPGTGAVLVKALDSGTVWTPAPNASQVAAANGHALAPSNQLWHSPDHGATWQVIKVDGADFAASAVAYAPTQSDIAYAIEGMAPFRVAKSVDGGATFAVVGSAGVSIRQVVVEAGAGDRLLGVAFEDALRRSVDGGATWQVVPRASDFPARSSDAVLFDASDPALRYVRRHALRSLDQGATWIPLPELNEEPIYPIATSPTRSGLAFGQGAVGSFGPTLTRTLDGGATWQEVKSGFSRFTSNFAILAGEAPNEYFLSTSVFLNIPPPRSVLWRSTDEGATWTTADGSPPYEILSFARAPGSPLLLYAGVDAPVGVAGFYRSVDHAATWQPVVTGDASGPVTAVAVDPANRDRIFAAYGPSNAAGSARLMRTLDAGATWTPLWIAMPSTTITALIVDPASSQRVFAGTSTQGVFFSTDAGGSWTALDENLSEHRVTALAFDPRDATKLYASTESGPYVVDLSSGLPAGHRWAVEYYHAAFEHYFVSADADEIAGLDAGVFEGWARTGESFRVGPTPSPDQAPVCRFFGVGFAPLSSHFYTPYPDECAAVKNDPKWLYEKIAFGLRLPEANKGCLPGYAPLFRTWNRNRNGAPNHRYTTNHVTFQTMVQMGWVMEGEASTFAFACVPQ